MADKLGVGRSSRGRPGEVAVLVAPTTSDAVSEQPSREAVSSSYPGTRETAASNRRAKYALIAILSIYFTLAAGYNIVVPIGEAPDEPSHIEYVQIMLRTGQLPTIPRGSERFSYEAQQPPLYYVAQLAWIGTLWPGDQLLPPLRENPAFTFSADIPANAYLHEYPPSMAVAAHLMRLLSALMGLGALCLVWLSARDLWPHNVWAAPLSTGFIAFLPGFTFTSSTVTNDMIAALTGSALLYLMLRMLRQGVTIPLAALAGTVLGLSLLSKATMLVFVPLLLLALALAPLSQNYGWSGARSHAAAERWPAIAGKLRALVLAGAVAFGAALIVGVWPFVHNLLEYGDPFARSAVFAVKSDLKSPMNDIPYFWLDRGYVQAVFDSLWGVFGLRTVDMQPWTYATYHVVLVSGVVASVVSLRHASKSVRRSLVLLGAIGLAMYVGLAYLNTLYWAVQGRLLLPALPALALMVGRLAPTSINSRAGQRVIALVIGALLTFFVMLNISALTGTLIPAYYK